MAGVPKKIPNRTAIKVMQTYAETQNKAETARRLGMSRNGVRRVIERMTRDEEKVLQPCGTVAAARRHQRHGEIPCEPCLAAVAEDKRKWQAERVKAQWPVGTRVIYHNKRHGNFVGHVVTYAYPALDEETGRPLAAGIRLVVKNRGTGEVRMFFTRNLKPYPAHKKGS